MTGLTDQGDEQLRSQVQAPIHVRDVSNGTPFTGALTLSSLPRQGAEFLTANEEKCYPYPRNWNTRHVAAVRRISMKVLMERDCAARNAVCLRKGH